MLLIMGLTVSSYMSINQVKPQALYAAGWKNRAEHVPADPQALFKIASISKLYIAAATAKLVNDGSLSLDDTLADYLPELVGRIEYADQITLRMMVQHRSGIPNFVDHPEWDWGKPLPDLNAYLAFALDKPADFEPDSRLSLFQYELSIDRQYSRQGFGL